MNLPAELLYGLGGAGEYGGSGQSILSTGFLNTYGRLVRILLRQMLPP